MSSDFQMHFMKCVVCGVDKDNSKSLQFFKFPREINRCRSWLKAIGKKELITIPIEDLCELLVCASHFNPACFNEKGSRLHKVGIPSLTPNPPLSDNVMAGYPKHRASSNSVPLTHVFSLSEPIANSNTGEGKGSQRNMSSVIDYDLPLMNSLETLIHDNYLTVQKPAGIPNSIAVPLMSYCSSTKQGTVFGVDDPGSAFDLPVVPFIEPVTQHVFKADKKIMRNKLGKVHNIDPLNHASNVDISQTQTKVDQFVSPTMPSRKLKDMPYSMQPNTIDESLVLVLNQERPETRKILTKKSILKTRPNYVNPYTRLIGHNEITGKSLPNSTSTRNKPCIISNIKLKNPTSRIFNRPLKQYTNTKHKNLINNKPGLDFPNTGTTDQKHTRDPYPIVIRENNKNKRHGINTFNVSTSDKVENSQDEVAAFDSTVCGSGETTETLDNINNLQSSDTDNKHKTSNALFPDDDEVLDDRTGNEITFVPYTQYEENVSPESPTAHIGEGTLEYYGLPLMNCIGTIFQNNMQNINKSRKKDIKNMVIDVPLMQCLKTLEYSNIQ